MRTVLTGEVCGDCGKGFQEKQLYLAGYDCRGCNISFHHGCVNVTRYEYVLEQGRLVYTHCFCAYCEEGEL